MGGSKQKENFKLLVLRDVAVTFKRFQINYMYSNLTWKLFVFWNLTGCRGEVVAARGSTAFKIRRYNNNRFKKIKLLKW